MGRRTKTGNLSKKKRKTDQKILKCGEEKWGDKMLVQPKELLVSGPLWVMERANPYFILQRRKGRGKGFSALFVGTLDSVREVKPASYRILHQAEGSEVYLLVSESMSSQEAIDDWDFLEREFLPTLADFEAPEEATEFI